MAIRVPDGHSGNDEKAVHKNNSPEIPTKVAPPNGMGHHPLPTGPCTPCSTPNH
jgi:hypothetical protein